MRSFASIRLTVGAALTALLLAAAPAVAPSAVASAAVWKPG